jgi:hypothetical protein
MFVSNATALTGAQAGDEIARPETATWFFDPLVARSYDVVVIDPPWSFKTRSPNGQRKSASMHYRVMTLAGIMGLPVRELLTDSAVVYLWTTGPLLDEAIATLKAWGITYAAHFAWRKISRNGKMQWGTGYWARSCHETILAWDGRQAALFRVAVLLRWRPARAFPQAGRVLRDDRKEDAGLAPCRRVCSREARRLGLLG